MLLFHEPPNSSFRGPQHVNGLHRPHVYTFSTPSQIDPHDSFLFFLVDVFVFNVLPLALHKISILSNQLESHVHLCSNYPRESLCRCRKPLFVVSLDVFPSTLDCSHFECEGSYEDCGEENVVSAEDATGTVSISLLGSAWWRVLEETAG